jgi:uncharacterized protein YsxB (DUF464 family)
MGEQLEAVRHAHADAFRKDMIVCAAISGVCVVATLGAYRRNPEPILATRGKLIREEQNRLKDLKAAKAQHIVRAPNV